MKRAKLRNILLLAATLLMPITVQAAGYAATPSKTSAVSNTNTLKLSPVRSDITVQQGSTQTVKVYVTNLTASPVILKPIENDFVAGDESGTPSLILDENSYAPSHSLKRFMVPLQNITVGPKSTSEVDVTVRVPKTAQAGGYFGAIRFAPATGSGGQVDLSGSVASLILLTVPGPTVEQLTLTNFDVQQNGGTATNFRTPDGLSLLLRFQNKGNVQEGPFGQVYVQKGKKIVYTANFNQAQPHQQVLPDSYRRWTVPLKGFTKFGKYTVGGTFTYGSKGQAIQIEKTVWIIPTAYILGGIGLVVLLIAIGGGSFFFLRSYKRKILRSSRRRY